MGQQLHSQAKDILFDTDSTDYDKMDTPRTSILLPPYSQTSHNLRRISLAKFDGDRIKWTQILGTFPRTCARMIYLLRRENVAFEGQFDGGVEHVIRHLSRTEKKYSTT